MSTIRRAAGPLVVLALVVAAALTMFGGEDHKTLTAHFPRTISIFEGSDVRILGVPVGKVDEVTPKGTEVVVKMHYDADVKVPADAKAVVVAPAVVGDRYIQLTPAYDGGQVLASDAVLDTDRTAIPLELDQVYESIDELTVALGPTGANRDGALTDLLRTTADNFGGQGAKFHQTIEDFGKLSATLDDNKEELFDSTAELGAFMSTLAQNDQTVREFNQSLAEVSTMLAGEREELSASMDNLATALAEVTTFVEENRDVLSRDIRGLNRVARTFARHRKDLDEILSAGPLALNNLHLAYNPQTGTLDTNSNMGHMGDVIKSDPSRLVCGFIAQADESGTLCDLVETILPRPAALASRSGAGTGSGAAVGGEPYDPSFGGLVEVER